MNGPLQNWRVCADQCEAAEMSRLAEQLQTAIDWLPVPATIDPETQQPHLRARMARDPVPCDRAYAYYYQAVIMPLKEKLTT